MSDFDLAEASVSDSSPFELYEFVGTYRSYYMTSDNVSHSLSGRIYEPVSGLKRGAIKAGTHEEDNTDLNVSIPIVEQIVKDYAYDITPPSLILTIYRFQRNAANYVTFFKGKVVSISLEEEYANFKLPSVFGNILQGNVPNVYIQPPCNNVLFDERCKVNRVSNSVSTEIVSVDGNEIAISSIGSFASDYFIGGEIAISSRNERRMIVDQVGTTLYINYPFSKIGFGTVVQVTAGCDHSFNGENGCAKFNNRINFGGFPYVPGEGNNPFTKGIV